MARAIWEKRVGKKHLNHMGTLHGGNLMKWMDEVGGSAAYCHAEHLCVTIQVDSFEFLRPVLDGEVLLMEAFVTRSWNTSIEVGIYARVQNHLGGEYHIVASAYYVYVALDEYKKPMQSPEFIPSNDEERARWEEAGLRRQRRLEEKNRQKKQ